MLKQHHSSFSAPHSTTARRKFFLSAVLFPALLLTSAVCLHAAIISDRSGSAIYWGGKHVNIKPSHYTDSIGRRTNVDQMEVVVNDDIATVTITGSYFYNYVHNVKHTRILAPGDLYIASKGWKVSGTPPHTNDIFEASEGWDYVVSYERKKVYTLEFSGITMTSDAARTGKYRAHQAWRGGYGREVEDAKVLLTDKSLTFIFSIKNMALGSDIGVHWTMKCGNDIIEGNVSIPALAVLPLPAEVTADPADPDDLIPASIPIPAAALYPQAFPGTATTSYGWVLGGVPLLPPVLGHRSDDDPVFITPYMPPYTPPNNVPLPPSLLLLLGGLAAIVLKKGITRK